MIINFVQTIKKKVIKIPIAHNEGNYFAKKDPKKTRR